MFGCVWSGLGTLGMPSCLAVFSNSYASWNLSVFRSWPFPVERCLGATGAEGQRQPVHRNDDLATLGVFLESEAFQDLDLLVHLGNIWGTQSFSFSTLPKICGVA